MTNGHDAANGLTKREEFAKAVLQGLMANPERYRYVSMKIHHGEWTQEEATSHNTDKAVFIADALIVSLNKNQGGTCKRCGSTGFEADNKFCSHCGADLLAGGDDNA